MSAEGRQGRICAHRSCIGRGRRWLVAAPTELLIFGNPRGGTPYNEPAWLAKRHRLGSQVRAASAMAAGLETISDAAATK